MSTISFPDANELRLCSDWCRPIHMVESAIAGQPFAKYFDVDDFMWMGKLHRRGRPDLILHKHCHTRRYLNLDADGHAYRYLSPPPGSTLMGQYRIHRDLVDAIDDVWLYEMPWLAGSGCDDETRGLSWEQRWSHPDVGAWVARRAARLDARDRARRRSRSRSRQG